MFRRLWTNWKRGSTYAEALDTITQELHRFRSASALYLVKSLIRWWRIRDLNPGPTDYDSAALTAELIRHI